MKPPPDRFPGESRDPFIRLLNARRVGPGFRRESVFTVSHLWTICFLLAKRSNLVLQCSFRRDCFVAALLAMTS
jgi:hypothetical protein